MDIGTATPQPVYHRHLGHHDEGEAGAVLGEVEGDLLVDQREGVDVGDVGGEGGREELGEEAVVDDALGQLQATVEDIRSDIDLSKVFLEHTDRVCLR